MSNPKVGRSEHDLSSFHIFTCDFGRTIPVNIIECIQGDKIDINLNSFFRMTPLVVPTFGNARFLTRSFFVPSRVVEPAWQNFIAESSDTTVKKTLLSFTNNEFVAYFFDGYVPTSGTLAPTWNVGQGNTLVVRVDDNVDACDICLDYVYDNSGTTTHVHHKFNLTDRGRWILQVLQGLGYSLNWVYSTFTNAANGDATPFDMIPLRAFARCLYDYIYPSQYVQLQGVGWLFSEPTKYSTLKTHLDAIVSLLFAPYEQDVYTSAWDTMNNVVANSKSYSSENILGASIDNGTNIGLRVDSNDDTTGILQNYNTNNATLSSQALMVIQRIADTLTRYNIVGTRFAERMKAIFGFNTKEDKINQSVFLKSFVMDSSLEAVPNLTQSEAYPLGELGGRGTCSDSGTLNFEASEHGYLIFITQIIPSIGYYQGRAPWTLARAPFEYYNPSFDGMYMSPLRNDELFADYQYQGRDFVQDVNYGLLPAGVYGFAPFYNQYKRGFDRVTGDFRLGSRNANLAAYHTMRILPQPSNTTPMYHNANFLQVMPYDYDRIFAQGINTDLTLDFYSVNSNVKILVLSDGRAALFSQGNKLMCMYSNSTLSSISLVEYNISLASVLYTYINQYGYAVVGTAPGATYTSSANYTVIVNGNIYVATSGVLSPSYTSLLSETIGASESKVNDHFIGYFNFRIKAHRNMLSFSDSIPMFDHSKRDVTTHYEGTQL